MPRKPLDKDINPKTKWLVACLTAQLFKQALITTLNLLPLRSTVVAVNLTLANGALRGVPAEGGVRKTKHVLLFRLKAGGRLPPPKKYNQKPTQSQKG